jgi:hypothetical protein
MGDELRMFYRLAAGFALASHPVASPERPGKIEVKLFHKSQNGPSCPSFLRADTH